MNCNICNGKLKKTFISNQPISISSDGCPVLDTIRVFKCTECGHLQKQKDQKIDKIYESYKNNDINNGMDQMKFDGEIPSFRTDIILESIEADLIQKGKLLDVGTGTGVFLRSCSKSTQMEMYGYDLNELHKNDILNIKNVKKFYSKKIEDINIKFNMISLIHVLEHIPDPKEFLTLLKSKLEPKGIVLIQVPDIENNQNDILIYDHLSHFTKKHLFILLKKVFKGVKFIKTPISNELTVIAGDWIESNFKPKETKELEFEHINTLNQYLSNLKNDIYIFGTSPICIYYANIVRSNNKLKGFLDEDISKEGKELLKKRIYHPQKIKSSDQCFIPLKQSIYEKVSENYKNINFISIKEALNNGEL